MGYDPNLVTETGQSSLTFMYAGAPCVIKFVCMILLVISLRKPMFRSLFVLGLLSAFIFGCGTRSIAIYEGETPSFNLESFFNGKVKGWGIVLNRNNDVVKRFKVNVEGYFSADKSSGKLVEKFFWSDGKRESVFGI